MAIITIIQPDGTTSQIDTTTGLPPAPSAIPAPEPSPTPVAPPPEPSPTPIVAPPPAPPPPPPTTGITLDQVYALYVEFLGRQPDYQTEALPRVGADYDTTYREIRCSQEAANYRQNHGLGPDAFCGGGPGTQPVPTPPPPAPPQTIDLTNLGNFLNTVIQALTHITGQIGDQTHQIVSQVGAGVQEISTQVLNNLNKFVPTIGNALNQVTGKLGQIVTGLIPTTLSLVGSALGGVETIAAAFLNNAADLNDIVDAIVNAGNAHQEGLGGFLHFVISNAFSDGLMAALTGGAGMDANTITEQVRQLTAPILAAEKARLGIA